LLQPTQSELAEPVTEPDTEETPAKPPAEDKPKRTGWWQRSMCK